MKRVLFDTNIYGEMVIDPDLLKLKQDLTKNKGNIIIYGVNLIRKELRATSKKVKVKNRKLRIVLLNLYDEIAQKHQLRITDEMLDIADSYYKAYREFGGSKSKRKIINDFIIVACATIKQLDIVVSEDEKSMLTENAIRAYKLINSVAKKKTPNFISYDKFKELLRSGQPNKFSNSPNKTSIFLIFLNFLPNIFLMFLCFFGFHMIKDNKTTIKNFRKKSKGGKNK